MYRSRKVGSWCACPWASCAAEVWAGSDMGSSERCGKRDPGGAAPRRAMLVDGRVREPGGVLLGRLDEDAGGHDAVADAADLGALDVVLAGDRGLEPAEDAPARDGVLLQAEHRHREAVEHVPRLELEVVELVDLDVELVRGLDVVLGVELAV